MLKIVKSSVRDTIIYSIGTFSSKLSGFILVPLYTNTDYMSASDYGVLNLVEANLLLLISVFSLGLNYAFERWYHDKEFSERRDSIFFTILTTTTCVSILLALTLIPLSKPLSDLLFDADGYAYIFSLMIVNAGLEIIAQTPNSLIRLRERPVLYTTVNIIKLVISLTCTVVFVAYFKLGLEGVYYGQIAGAAAYFVILSGFLVKNIRFEFEWKILKGMIWFRLPFMFPIIALNIFSFNDRFVLSRMISVVDTGIYSLGAKLANTIRVFLLTAIWLALMPTVYKMMDNPANKRFYSKIMTYLGFTVIIFVMLFSFYGRELVMLLAKEEIYWEAYKVIPVVSLGIFFGMLKDVSMIGLNITKRTKSIATITVLITVINLGLNIFLVPYWGIMGAASSGLLAQLLFFVIIYIVAQRQYAIPYELKKVGMMLMVAGALFAVSYATDELLIWVRIPLKLLLVMSFPFILYFLGFYEEVELTSLKGFWDKWKNPLKWKENIAALKF